jgi:hypothetical protein
MRFADHRGDEGDGDILRVGGVYGGYGNRLAKVMPSRPWAAELQAALVAAFRAEGVDARAVDSVSALSQHRLEGEIRNFSVESRWSTAGHISGNVRLFDSTGRLAVEKPISHRETAGMGAGVFIESATLEETLNKTFAGYITKVAADPDIKAVLRPRK